MFDPRLLQDTVTLLVVVNPVGIVPLFLSAVRDEPPEARRRIAGRAVAISATILVAFIVGGQILLGAMGIKMSSFRIAGGLVLLVIGLRMVLEKQAPAESRDGAPPERGDVAVFPLAMPFIAGPGTMMSVVLLTDNDRFSILEQAETAAILLAVLAVTYLLMRLSEKIYLLLGDAGVNIVTRVMGLVLSAMAVESILTGIRGYFA